MMSSTVRSSEVPLVDISGAAARHSDRLLGGRVVRAALPPIALTVAEAAAELAVSTDTIYRAIKAETLEVRRLTPRGKMFIPVAAIERWLNGLA
jgi:excisionase family DNA binding protein